MGLFSGRVFVFCVGVVFLAAGGSRTGPGQGCPDNAGRGPSSSGGGGGVFPARELQSAQSGPAPALSRGFPGHTAIAGEGLSPLRTGPPQRRVVDNDDHGGAFSLPNNTPKSLPQKWQGNGEHASQHRRGCPGPAPTSGFASFQRASASRMYCRSRVSCSSQV